MKKINLLDIVIFLLVILFVYAAFNKFIDHDLFRTQIGKSMLIMRYGQWISWIVPSLEMLIALLLLFPKTQLLALYASFSMMLMFTLYIAVILNFSPSVPCSCGGILSSMGWTEHLIFNICFTILPVVGIGLYNRQNARQENFRYTVESEGAAL